eukprot:Nk52_evm19s356 gene=Nk52_evmTU19s356
MPTITRDAGEVTGGEEADLTESGGSIWESVLSEVAAASRHDVKQKYALFLGDDRSGKSSLISALKNGGSGGIGGMEAPTSPQAGRTATNDSVGDERSGVALRFTYLDVKEEEQDEVMSQLKVWSLDGKEEYKNLLPFAIDAKTFRDSCVVLVCDLSAPWAVMESLSKWMGVFEDHILECKLPRPEAEEAKQNLEDYVKEYNENSSTGYTGPSGRSTQEDGVETAIVPLAEGVLERNLGIPIIVACTKSDSLTHMEKDGEINEEQMDFIQFSLRKFCMKYGAALVYTSVKENKNIKLLKSYIFSRLYSFPVKEKGSFIERNLTFIPSGWEIPSKLDILSSSFRNIDLNELFEEVIKKPHSRKAGAMGSGLNVVRCEDDQTFLAKQQMLLGKSFDKSSSAPAGSPNRPYAPGPSSIEGVGSDGNKAPASSGAHVSESPSATASPKANDGVLADFFNSLLQKKTGPSESASATGSQESLRSKGQGGSPDRNTVRKGAAAELDRIKSKR